MRVVVVGAGLGGLAVSCRLAALGHHVELHERRGTVGGKIGTYAWGGRVWDTGPSLLTLPGHLRDTFEACGGWPETLTLQRSSPLFRYRLADGTWTDAVPGWDEVLDRGRRAWEVSRAPFLEHMPSLRALRHATPAAVRAVAPGRSLAWAGRHLDPTARDVLWRYATYAGADPRRAPAALTTIPWVEHAHGGWTVDGGMRRIVDAMEQRARELGVVIELGSHLHRPAAEVVVRGDEAGGVEAGRDVAGGDGGGRRRSYSAFALMLALDDPPPMARHTVLFPRDYRAEFDELAAGRDVADPAIYLHAPAPDRWFLLVNAPARSGADRSATVLAALADRGIEVRDRLRHSACRTPLDIARDSGTVDGAIYGGTGLLRPRNRSRHGYRVGGTTHPGGGIPLVLLSARITAELIGPAGGR